MPYYSHVPSEPLSHFVQTFWLMSGDIGEVPPVRSRIVPHGLVELVISLDRASLSFLNGARADTVRAPLWAGPYSNAFLIDPAEFNRVAGVRFRPGKARQFLPVPVHELHNKDVPMELFCAPEAQRLADQLTSAPNPDGVFRALSDFLTAKLRQANCSRTVDKAVEAFTEGAGVRSVSSVQAETGLSHTRFIQLFREHVGLTPRLFCRIQRFRSAVKELESGRPVRWTDLALSSGYFDQAHFCREFRAFSGLTPSQYVESTTSGSGNPAGRLKSVQYTPMVDPQECGDVEHLESAQIQPR